MGLSAWRRLEKGMSFSQVRQILGEPKKIDSGFVTRWYYGSEMRSYSPERVEFIEGSGVSGWEEP